MFMIIYHKQNRKYEIVLTDVGTIDGFSKTCEDNAMAWQRIVRNHTALK
jgi:hypothetical protein